MSTTSAIRVSNRRPRLLLAIMVGVTIMASACSGGNSEPIIDGANRPSGNAVGGPVSDGIPDDAVPSSGRPGGIGPESSS